MTDSQKDGVLDKTYARERVKKPHLAFRLRERALAAADAVKQFGARNEGALIVDLGAAEGATLLEMARLQGEGTYIGIEYDTGLVESAPKLPKNISLVQGDVSNMSMIADSSVDAVTALALLEHLQDPQKTLQEVYRVLKPGGVFVATAPSPLWDSIANRLAPKNVFGGDHHYSEITEEFMRKLAKESRFTFMEFRRFMWFPLGFLPYLNIPVSASLAWRVDRLVGKAKIFNFLFVNQRFVLKK